MSGNPRDSPGGARIQPFTADCVRFITMEQTGVYPAYDERTPRLRVVFAHGRVWRTMYRATYFPRAYTSRSRTCKFSPGNHLPASPHRMLTISCIRWIWTYVWLYYWCCVLSGRLKGGRRGARLDPHWGIQFPRFTVASSIDTFSDIIGNEWMNLIKENTRIKERATNEEYKK